MLIEALEEAHERGEADFGHRVLPRLLSSHRLFAYDFSTNEVPGISPYEEAGYWRDVGTLDSYFEAFNPQWPIFSSNYPGCWVPQQWSIRLTFATASFAVKW